MTVDSGEHLLWISLEGSTSHRLKGMEIISSFYEATSQCFYFSYSHSGIEPVTQKNNTNNSKVLREEFACFLGSVNVSRSRH